MKKTVFSFGEVLWDILPSETILGGAPFNFAYRINSLGDTGLMISRLGDDELGKEAFEKVKTLGLKTDFLQFDKQLPTGSVQVAFDEENNPDYYIVPNVAYDQIELTEALAEAVTTADCLCFGTLAQRAEKSRKTIEQLLEKSAKSMKFLDINLRKNCYNLQTVRFSLQKADVLKLNEDELYQLGRMLDMPDASIPQLCEELLSKWSLKYCLVTLAENGAFVASKDGESVYEPGFKVALADSLGAGDAFSAGFIHKILRRPSIEQACEYGNILAALVATSKGATQPVTLEEVEQFRSRECERNICGELEKFINQPPK
jgi:fructokinase